MTDPESFEKSEKSSVQPAARAESAKVLSNEYFNEIRSISKIRDSSLVAMRPDASDTGLESGGVQEQNQQFKGELFLIGGAADDTFKDLVARLPKNAKVLTVGLASADGDDYSLELAHEFEKAGIKAENITAYCLGPTPADAYKSVDKLPDHFDLIYFGGGDQSLLKQRFHEVEKLQEALKEGCIVAGTSAGAAVMSGEMITGGMASKLKHAQGFSLLPWAIMDTHVHEREREDRDLSALYDVGDAKIPVIGIDEDTRVRFRWEDGHLIGEVGGEGVVHVFKTSDQGLNVTSSRQVKPQLTYGTDGAGKGKAALVWELKAGDKFVLH